MFTFKESNDLPGMTWCLRFGLSTFNGWKEDFTIHLWEGKNQTSFNKAKEVEQRYIQEAFEDIEMAEPEDEEEEGEEDRGGTSLEDGSDDEHDLEAPQDDTETVDQSAAGSKNEQLAVGYKNDLSFVTRGDKIGVFAHTGDRIKFRTTIDRITDMGGKRFSPGTVREVSHVSKSSFVSGHAA